MSKVQLLCLDDKPDEIGLSLQRISRKTAGLKLWCESPKAIKAQIDEIRQLQRDGRIDGLIVDLRLDQSADPPNTPVQYRAQQLASELRSLMAEKKIGAFPITLWSITQKFARSYDRDITSHDLFDLVLDKEKLHLKEHVAGRELVALSKGYLAIASASRGNAFWENVLEMPAGIYVDPRVFDQFLQNLRGMPVHILARFILQKLIHKPGPLIDEDTLCARLGVDIDSYRESVLAKTIWKIAGYRGPFGDGWQRWWWAAVESWWRSEYGDGNAMLSLTATERVMLLQNKGKYRGIVSAKPIQKGYGNRFTTVCRKLLKPLDPIDGFKLASNDMEVWHDTQYVCGKVALRPQFYRLELPLDPLELERQKMLRRR